MRRSFRLSNRYEIVLDSAPIRRATAVASISVPHSFDTFRSKLQLNTLVNLPYIHIDLYFGRKYAVESVTDEPIDVCVCLIWDQWKRTTEKLRLCKFIAVGKFGYLLYVLVFAKWVLLKYLIPNGQTCGCCVHAMPHILKVMLHWLSAQDFDASWLMCSHFNIICGFETIHLLCSFSEQLGTQFFPRHLSSRYLIVSSAKRYQRKHMGSCWCLRNW